MTIHKILCAHDLGPASDAALEQAFRLGRQLGARVVVLHVAPQPYPRPDALGVYSPEEMALISGFARRELAAAREVLEARIHRANPPGEAAVPCEAIVREGTPVEAVNAMATATGADLLIVGTHARRGLAHVVVGSVAERLVRTAPCPVLVARSAAPLAAAVAG